MHPYPIQVGLVLLSLSWFAVGSAQAQDWQPERPPGSAELIERYHRILEGDPFHQQAFTGLLREYVSRGGLAALQRDYGRRISEDPENGGLHLLLARLRSQANQPEAALVAVDRAIELGCEQARAYVLRARLRRLLGDGEGAIADCRQALDRSRRQAERLEILRILGEIQISLGQREEGLESLRQMARLAPLDRTIRQELVEILVDAGFEEEALIQAAELVRLAGTDTRARVLFLRDLAVLQEELGRYREAIESWYDLLGLTRGGTWLEREAQAGLERSYRGWGRLDLFLERLDDRLARAGRDRFASVARARILQELGRLEESVASYRQAIFLWPRDDQIPIELAVLLKRMGDNQDAIEVLEEAIGRWPGDLPLIERLVESYLESGRPFDASFLLRSQEDLVGDDAGVLVRIMQLYRRVGDDQAAGRLAERLMAHHGAEMSVNLALVADSLAAGRCDAMQPELRRLLEEGGEEEVLQLIGLLTESQETDLAIEVAIEGRNRFADSPDLAVTWMRLVQGQGMEQALEASREVLLLSSDRFAVQEAFAIYYRLLEELGLADWAVDHYLERFATDPFDHHLGRLLLMLQIARQDSQGALRTLAALEAICPDGQDPRQWAISTLEDWPSPGAWLLLARLGERDPAGSWRTQLIGARIAAAAGQPAEAWDFLQRLREQQLDHPAVLFAIGQAYQTLPDGPQAGMGCWILGMALDADPTNDRFRLGRLDCLLALDKRESALQTALEGFEVVRQPELAGLLFDRLLRILPSAFERQPVFEALETRLDRTNPQMLPWLRERVSAQQAVGTSLP
ncbi:MAG: tetratricopeptide repeat protein [Bradymonadales bacterium]|nr:tetratricopeptide repeat protein [Bradymonadales bacterium]